MKWCHACNVPIDDVEEHLRRVHPIERPWTSTPERCIPAPRRPVLKICRCLIGPPHGQEPVADNLHVYPLADLIEHDTQGDECVCGPTSEPVERDDGTMGWLLVHHSLDGREANE